MQSLFQRSLTETNSGEEDTRSRILQAALRLFAAKGYEGTTTKDLAGKANVAEGTLFRYFPNKKAILIEVATRGWVDILTDLLTELSEMGSYKAVAQVMRRRVLRMRENSDLLRVCFIEAQFHPELKERIQSEVIAKMTDVAEAFFQTAIDRGVYRPMNPKIVAQVFLGMFAIAGFSSETILDSNASPLALQEMAEGIAEIFLNGVLVK
ncbi:MAG: TetR/AcrR family transcriptional regulator [Microcystis sp.]|jgi:AcrR family transcriptional regulator|uniref:Similar to tr/Q4C8F5/Q4C8F5_CROWT Regulatory protein n=1 Tax=Microcystis aeruginosa PCC 9717 TaxID=1160286 RepID=I4FLD7_MICAE|nr:MULTISPECIES: TetR/AcrR family transcriptional regulator [Microcystis]MCZ8364835.1 TetR/AcrR family transcriptional regulator [Microcystis sp. LE19-251.1A]MDJ0549503.1 TetR/AcrR family transcriptional regulator [Microcystis sp. M49637_WE12]NCR83059.1 TetR/AcrR family transcriptional regulator [Microcystis aeruginosa K13-10]MCZ8026435.1 TetR/AcrR family transcriptional regulator [Microcystis sp. LE19-10.1B]MCZ8045412.1 TetR/AcrR family transcriptional regulator [Microcystis sp. LE19-41.2A]